MSNAFWVAVAAMAVTLSISTVLGRAVCQMVPGRLRPAATLYLSPAFGLAVLVIFASMTGRHLPLGGTPVHLVLAAVVILAIIAERDRFAAFRHMLTVVCFGLVCGSPVLGGLFVHGAYFAYNDTFTYLAQSIWLQTHPFSLHITPDLLTPLSSQIGLYQAAGLRMGASYLIALVQSFMGTQWPYSIYPAVMVSAVAACCLAAGFPLSRLTQTMSRRATLALLSLPAFGLNGLTFGSVFGFAPQTLGIMFGSSVAFTIGYLLHWITIRQRSARDIAVASVPGALLFAALTYAYSEIIPFVVLAVLASALFVIARHRDRAVSILSFGVAFAVAALILLNTETLRAIAAIRTQANVVVGGPVNWSLSGFIAHALGVHGGAWDGFTWAMRGIPKSGAYFVGTASMLAIVALLALARRAIRKRIADYSLLPTAVMLAFLAAALLIFRYGVHSPFPIGIGQSWSQFKLAEWASPFVSVFVLLSVARLKKFVGKYLAAGVVCLLCSLIAVEAVAWPINLHGVYGYFTWYYGTPRSVGKYLTDFRETILETCKPGTPIYLDLHGDHIKARETLAMYLFDQPLKSDWHDDDYLNFYNSRGGKSERIQSGDCVVAAKDNAEYQGGVVSGPFRIVPAQR
ncbi:hypothetical protein [Paraburkholderia acidipaludis]|uniref:hypothetical protein n=1 Tax=Paraburkholderia acidipaludis TaxID=660537 RepID=UPI000481ACFF|nr:hypothetical protein [Paraburkholderia acidipaludis]